MSTVAVPSTVSFVHLSATQSPLKRDSAQPNMPYSSSSCTEAGYSTGMWFAASACSLWCDTVEDLPG